jgi:hypothetical protein
MAAFFGLIFPDGIGRSGLKRKETLMKITSK